MSDNTKLIAELRNGGTEDRGEIDDRERAAADALEAAEAKVERLAVEVGQAWTDRDAARAERDALAAVIEGVQCDDLCSSWDAQPCSCWKSMADTDAALREHDERLYAFIAGQFTSDVEYDGAEVIGRIRSIQHSLEPHGEGDCIVCENDPEGI